MAPYRVALIPPKGDRLDLVVPFDGSRAFSDLTATVIQRASKYRSLPSYVRQDHLKLCLGSDDGYLIEADDIVQDVITTSDVLFVIFLDGPLAGAQLDDDQLSVVGALQIQIITPALAQRNPEFRHIPLLKDGRYYPPSSTLREIKDDVAQYLRLPTVPPEQPMDAECNCKLAELLVKRGEWEKIPCEVQNCTGCCFTSSRISGMIPCARCHKPVSSHNDTKEAGLCHSYILRRSDLSCGHVIHSQCLNSGVEYECPSSCYTAKHCYTTSSAHVWVVSGNGHIEKLELASNNHPALMARLADRFGENFTHAKAVFFKGGLEDGDAYNRLPVVAVCATARHQPNGVSSQSCRGAFRTRLDLHTIEGPINTHNLDLTLENAGLAEIAINGILTLYAVEWTYDANEKKGNGKDAIFTAACHWRLPSVQSDRGMAAVLASLRVFSHLVGSEDFDDRRQNEVLSTLHILTRFPPAVRAAHILMDGKSLKSNESAALVQSIAGVAEELIPQNLISNDPRRSLEGARLVLGLILHNVRRQQAPEHAGPGTAEASRSRLPYISGYHTVDLRDVKTLEVVTEPVLTNVGLVNKGVFEAFSISGPLKEYPSSYLTDRSQEDSVRIRVALLYGGAALEAPYYDADALGAAIGECAAVQSRSLDVKSLSCDIAYLASLCEETKLVVVAPRQLSDAKAPCLTLDRNGNLAVYTGRAACAAPGHDHAVFHPLTGAEENVDVTIIAQVLEPILLARKTDGTHVFDLFSASFRHKDSLPTELVVFCVDCSQSMNESSGFPELEEGDDDGPLCSSVDHDVVLDDEDDTEVPLEEIKSWLRGHESYEDILHIVHHYPFNRHDVVRDILEFLRTLISRELVHLATKRRRKSRWATFAFSRTSSTERQMNSLRRTLTGLNLHERALSDFLLFTAEDPSFESKEFTWSYGDDLPGGSPSSSAQEVVELGDFCAVPQEYLCPISQVIFEDPVDTSDGFMFDRKAIERWYRVRKSSPLTGLPIEDTTLRHNEVMANQIKAWVKAEDVINSLPSTPKRTRLSARQSGTIIDFVGPSVRFSRQIPGSARLLDLHKIAFRGMRGLYARFSLYMGGVHLPCSEENMVQKGMVGSQTITISPNYTPHGETAGVSTSQEQMCLIRVYGAHDFSEESFNYWVPLNSEITFASIIFRNWRFDIQDCAVDCDYDKSPWTGLRDGGDAVAIGTIHDSWASLSEHLWDLPRTKIQEHEEIYGRIRDAAKESDSDSDPESNSESDSDTIPGELYQYDRHRVLKVRLYKYESPEELEQRELQKQKVLSRMAVTKQVFSQFINRLIAYNFPTNVGLVTFGTAVSISQRVTSVIENFRQAVDSMKEEGDTALWDSVALAADHLIESGRRYPEVKKRIICLSDGQYTSSVKKVEDVCRTLIQHDIVVDSVCIGEENNSALRTVSYLTGGYKFVPNSVEEASALCELEPVLSIHERPRIYRPMSASFFSFPRTTHSARADPVTRDDFPDRKTHENLSDTFIQIGRFERTGGSRFSEQAQSSSSSIRSRRLLEEIRDIANHSHPSYDVYISEINMGFWKIALQGPSGSAYASGAFVLYLDMGEDYPRKAPSGRFITPIFHPNVNRHGRICHSIFDRNWTVDTTNKQILDTIFGLLLVPEFTDPINTVVTLNFYWDEVAFKDEVQKHIQRHARKSRAELGRAILEGSRT
ncbi:uncharacterized protein Z519_03059 [Cladophialophora bantiana CBS 173.52]|uniref:peptidylprolyl isomerase n=1 Tax=Cladophialophora bantiana (strain ATCC 10958 / CBS 173.52 / CDC B-1940 / NIH 8579) TaxID=1442370 RepID=A0A0D2HRB9_CLAB1|nr:uncharacterized protein Z519_03059 [Cladophialophora bantiana CBS 173.52]KIW95993.1 hypothetical protein Z519_03059 [Cladophialophora bantiana CBS 173.52]